MSFTIETPGTMQLVREQIKSLVEALPWVEETEMFEFSNAIEDLVRKLPVAETLQTPTAARAAL